MKSANEYLKEICDLPEDFHEAGVMSAPVLEAMFQFASKMEIGASAETGCGKSTLLLSWLSESHTVFTLEAYGSLPCESYRAVSESNLLRQSSVDFVLGPSQRTVPNYDFPLQLDLVLIDGPHGFPFPMLEYYYFYPVLNEGSLLIVDDIHIPTIRWLHDFLAEDAMFELEHTVEHTAFFRRTSEPALNPLGDDWWLQGYNANRFEHQERPRRASGRIKGLLRRLIR